MDNYTNAYSVVENRRLAARARFMDKQREMAENVPGLEDINRQINRAGADRAMAVISKQPAEAEKYKREMDRLVRERKALLEKYGYSEKDLEPIYYCHKCKDTGVINGKACSCLKEQITANRQKKLTKFSPVPDVSFEQFNSELYPKQAKQTANGEYVVPYNHMKTVFNYCMEYSKNFSLNNGNILMYGGAGLGKTHLACSIAKVCIEKGFVVMYASAQSFFNKVEQAKYTEEDVLSDILACDLFILDDLGAEHITNYSLSILYNIVNTRTIEKKPTIFTTNYTSGPALKQRYGEKIYSRILANCRTLYFHGDDIRMMKR